MPAGDVTPGGSPARLEDLLEQYQRGDADAARSLVLAFSPPLARFCLLAGDPPSDVDDVLQDIWLRVHQARHTYLPGAPAAPWLFGIARHVRIDAYRKRRRVTVRELATEKVPEPAVDPVSPLPDSNFEQILRALPESQREVLMMLKGLGMSLEEVARATCSTVGAVKQKAHRAYDRLRSMLADRVAGAEQS
jgi:RNA polymerase sigma-70 factor (ECF subfamily)